MTALQTARPPGGGAPKGALCPQSGSHGPADHLDIIAAILAAGYMRLAIRRNSEKQRQSRDLAPNALAFAPAPRDSRQRGRKRKRR